jgi:cytochrome P450
MEGRFGAGQESADLIEAFAFPLPIAVICELLGVPAADQDQFEGWSHAIVSSVAAEEEVLAAGTAMFHYFTALLAAKRRSPADDLTSALIAARDSGDSLDERELIAMLFLLLSAA